MHGPTSIFWASLTPCSLKALGRLLRGTDAAGAVPLLLAARNARLAAEKVTFTGLQCQLIVH